MRQLKLLWRSFFDIREGERLRTLFMSLYLLFVLFAYYILKTVSRGLFLGKFDIDKLPILYMLIAAVGGVLAYLYTKLAVRVSLAAAVAWASFISIGMLVVLWFLIRSTGQAWIYYFFNIWVSLFSIILVSQGWLVAANVFNSWEAKRLYGILGLGAVLGAAFGGSFTAFTVRIVGTSNLLLASAFMVLLSYCAFLMVARQPGVSLAGAKAAEAEEASFSFADIVTAIRRYRHLQVIVAIITLTYIVDTMVEYQFSAAAKAAYGNAREITRYLGNFFGIYLNLTTFVLQFFLTAAVVSRFGVGGTLQVMPVALTVASVFNLLTPGVLSSAAARLTEAATRYTFNRTGMELLYLPLPADLKNRTKAFVDIFVDRLARGLGGLLLALLTTFAGLKAHYVSLVVMGICLAWLALNHLAGREYVATVRKRLAARRLDLESARVSVSDPATLALLVETARGAAPRQSAYALSLLAEVPGYSLEPLLGELAGSPHEEVRGKVFELARRTGFKGLYEQALAEMRTHRAGMRSAAIGPAVRYALAVGEAPERLAARLLEHPNEMVVAATVEEAASQPGLAAAVLTEEWIREAAASPDPARRCLATTALRSRGEEGVETLSALLRDQEPCVVEAACRAAAALQSRALVEPLFRLLAGPRLRGAAIDALTAYGQRICGTAGDLLDDPATPAAVRRQVPRVLQNIPHQRSVDELLRRIDSPDLRLRGAVLRALSRLRDLAPGLDYGPASVTQQIGAEARSYFELYEMLAPFRDRKGQRTAAGLLASTLEERLQRTIERVFRLLGLRYPPKDMHSAYLAVHRGGNEQMSAAVDFLDNVLDRELKRILLPLFEAPDILREKGQALFGVRPRSAEAALRELIETGDEWLVCCSAAAAAELGLESLRAQIEALVSNGNPEVSLCARRAAAAFAR